MVDKRAIIEHIRHFNRSARYEWLEMFDPSSLRMYLEHLQRSVGPRTAGSSWVRRGETAAAVTRRAEH